MYRTAKVVKRVAGGRFSLHVTCPWAGQLEFPKKSTQHESECSKSHCIIATAHGLVRPTGFSLVPALCFAIQAVISRAVGFEKLVQKQQKLPRPPQEPG